MNSCRPAIGHKCERKEEAHINEIKDLCMVTELPQFVRTVQKHPYVGNI